MYKVLIANEYNDYSFKLAKTLTNDKNICIVDFVDSKNEVFNSYLKNKPDILVMRSSMSDNFLSMYKNYFQKDFYNQSRQNIILLYDNSYVFPICQNKKIYKIIPYEASTDLIKETINEVFDKRLFLPDSEIKKQLYNLLLKLNIQPNDYKGTEYLIQAVLICYRNHKLLSMGLKKIYEEISKDFENEVSPETIQWRVENTFRAYNKSRNLKYLKNVFKYYDEAKSLSSKYFIELALDYLMELNDR